MFTPSLLTHPFTSGALPLPAQDATLHLLNLYCDSDLEGLPGQKCAVPLWVMQAQSFEKAGISVHPYPEAPGEADIALLHAPKDKTAAAHLIAFALKALKENGILVVAAANDAGGKRLKSMAESLGLTDIGETHKAKSRIVWGRKDNTIHNAKIEGMFIAGVMQQQDIHGQTLWTQPGLFGWDKMDGGTGLLLESLPRLKGIGADFGCGYGALTLGAMEKSPDITLTGYDADIRAVAAYKKNTKLGAVWADLTQSVNKKYDFILMNPPFHEEKNTATTLGQACIRTAHGALKPGGALHMVANAHLPYEAALRDLFKTVEKIAEQKGFKVFKALK